MKKILIFLLDTLAKAYLLKFKPEIIAITGNVGKTSTKEAISVVLSRTKRVRSSRGNLNNEFGVPLTITGDWADEYYEATNSFWFWFKVILIGVLRFVFGGSYPEVLVLEFGADRPGDIKKLARKFKPHIAVVTAVGEVPVHIEYFTSPESLAREKAKLLEGLGSTDYAVLNFDDQVVVEMRKRTKAKIYTFGFGEEAKFKISGFDMKTENNMPVGVIFKISYNDSFVPMRINGSLGKSQAWVASTAAAVGSIYGMNLVDIREALLDYHGPSGRLKILKGIKNTVIIDDSYNASPSSMGLALETINGLPARRKILVLGDMLELGKYTIEAHREIGKLAGSIADVLVSVGLRGKLIADSAENQLGKDRIFAFPTADMAKNKVQELIQEGDLVLVKGSQGIRMEKIVKEIIAEPLRSKELLVRQNKKWLKK